MSKIILFLFLGVIISFVISCSPKEIKSTQTQLPQAIGEPEVVPFQEIELHEDWILGDSFDYSKYKGIFHNEKEFKDVWTHIVNAWKELGYSNDKAKNNPVMPVIDFNKYSVIWYANRGSGASFVTINEILDFKDVVQVNITLVHSDYLTRVLNLWTIPKTEKSVNFAEETEYNFI